MLIVQKYGGTSVADADRIRKVAEYVVETVRKGNCVVVVVSAMAGETDRLLRIGHNLTDVGAALLPARRVVVAGGRPREPAEGLPYGMATQLFDRELDALVATGEQASAALLAMAIEGLGQPAVSLASWQVPIVTDSLHQRARMKYIETKRINAELSNGRVVVLAGFQGVDELGDVTTIGRGGSDTSAVAIAAALHADRCEIYSDVDGLFSADPNICPRAVKIEQASYEELLETAGAGAKVVHMHAVELAAKHDVQLELKKSPSVETTIIPPHPLGVTKGSDPMGGEGGTTITREEINMEKVLVSTVTHTSNEAKISICNVPNKVGLAARIFEPLARANINVDMIVQNVSSNGTSDVSFTIAKHDLKKAMQLTEVAGREMGAGKVEMLGDVAKISIIGVGMRSHAGVAAKMFETLAREGIDIQMISTSEIKVSVVVDSKYMERAVNALHKAFMSL